MKRKITDLEQKLLNDGWYLITKEYTGKNSEKTLSYEYTKCVPYDKDLGFQAIVKLNANRDKVINVGIPNIYVDKLDSERAAELHNRFLFLKDYVSKITQDNIASVNKDTRTLEDLDLTPRERYEISKILGTNELDKIAETKNLVVLLISKLPKKVDIVKILKVLTENDLCQVQ